MRANLKPGDWIVGLAGVDVRRHLGDSELWRIIYAMKVDDRLSLDEYYHHPEYRSKRPKKIGSREEQCGDNFYRIINGEVRHTGESVEHVGMDAIDGYGDRVFAGRDYWYFGKKAPAFPGAPWASKLRDAFVKGAVGIKYLLGGDRDKWNAEDFSDFQLWLDQQHPPPVPDPIHFYRWAAQRQHAEGSAAPTSPVVCSIRDAAETLPTCAAPACAGTGCSDAETILARGCRHGSRP